MADTEQEFAIGYVDKRRNNKGQETGTTRKRLIANTTNVADNDISVGALRARLAAISGTTYTTARLNSMTKNDMVYALRLSDELGTAAAGSV